MLWSDFVSAVNSHLGVEANRRGLETYRARYIRNAVLDLQRYIRGFREANKTTYTSADLTAEGQAQLATLPSESKPKAAYIYSTDEDLTEECARYRLAFYPWNSRQDLICGRLNFSTWWACCGTGTCPTLTDDEQVAQLTKAYVYTVSPMGRQMLIYPRVTASTRLLLVWDGLKYTFADDDEVPYPEQASEAVAAYVLAKIAKAIDKNLPLAQAHEADWLRLRLSLYRDFNETQMLNDERDEEYDATAVAP